MTEYQEYFMLDGKVARPCTEEQYRNALMEDRRKRADGDPNPSRVALTNVGKVKVSTVFLYLNHSFDDGPPMIFETMVFNGPIDGDCERCSTWEEAEAMHAEMVQRVRGALAAEIREGKG